MQASTVPRDFLPLTVDYREYAYAAAGSRAASSSAKAAPTEKETITARMIDRPLRPLVPAGLHQRDADHLLRPFGRRRARSGHPGDQRRLDGARPLRDPVLPPHRRGARRPDRRPGRLQPDQQPARRRRPRPGRRRHRRGGHDGRGRRQPALRADAPRLHLGRPRRAAEGHPGADLDVPRARPLEAGVDAPRRSIRRSSTRRSAERSTRR